MSFRPHQTVLRHISRRESRAGFSLDRLRPFFPAVLLALLTLLVGGFFLHSYLLPEFNVLLALLSFPFVLYLKRPGRQSWRFALFAALFLALFPLLHVKITFHLAVSFVLLFLVENSFGKLNSMPVTLIMVLSPLPHYFAAVFGFPLRLWLSQTAGNVFRLMAMPIEVKGNLFIQDGAEFSVDPACTGINLFVTGLVLFVILLSYQEKRLRKALPLLAQAALLVLGMALVLLANLFRIVSLVLLRSQPDTFAHDAVGMACLLLYFCLPMAGLVYFAARRWGKPLVPHPAKLGMPLSRWHIGVAMALVLGLGLAGNQGQKSQDLAVRQGLEAVSVAGYTACMTDDGMLALQGETALVYMKPPVPFYGADHYPEICWRAGGYTIRAPELVHIAGQAVMLARLETDDSHLYTAWWYDNGACTTLSSLDWRWRQVKGEPPFYLTNVTAGSRPELENAVREWLAGPKVLTF